MCEITIRFIRTVLLGKNSFSVRSFVTLEKLRSLLTFFKYNGVSVSEFECKLGIKSTIRKEKCHMGREVGKGPKECHVFIERPLNLSTFYLLLRLFTIVDFTVKRFSKWLNALRLCDIPPHLIAFQISFSTSQTYFI